MKHRHFLISLYAFFSLTSCTKEVDKVIVPVTRQLNEFNQTLSHTDVEILPDTKLRLKGSGLFIEKNF